MSDELSRTRCGMAYGLDADEVYVLIYLCFLWVQWTNIKYWPEYILRDV